jgi:hypothetical protein
MSNVVQFTKYRCSYCDNWFGGLPDYAIHFNAFFENPQVALCKNCGSKPEPTCENIWLKLSEDSPDHEYSVIEENKTMTIQSWKNEN